MTTKKRDYKAEYANYHSKPEQIKNRSLRNKARADAASKGLVKKGDGKDVDHKVPLDRGGSNDATNLRVTTKKVNRGWRKGKSGYNP